MTKNLLVLILPLLLMITGCGNDEPAKAPSIKIYKDTVAEKDTLISVKNQNQTYKEAYANSLKLWEVPLEERDVLTSLGNAHVIVCGREDGEPLVLLHGMNASSTMWYPNIQALSQHFRIYAIDFFLEPGGSSCKEVESTEEIMYWYKEIFDSLHLKEFNITGASRGGWLAMNIALSYPKQVKKLILLSPAQTFAWIKLRGDALANITYTISPKRERLREVMQTVTVDIDKIPQAYIDQYYIATREAKVNKCILKMRPFTEEQIRSLQMPVMMLIGDQDIVNGEKSKDRARELLPAAEVAVIQNSGHLLSIDQPKAVNQKILSFLLPADPLVNERLFRDSAVLF